ncbi:zinc ribbon-containing protein [Amphritea pacifica]|uniref:zinc ribbon-containing protein n=1 Tax=Amphritea pacifica TaxID=2811233 RepID=UPI001965B73A|nr:zinc ribbon-containing protein [Amphritea pacifica]MBN1006437.1 zinc ribbon-containing protein [Amphritea pacifica]
MSNNSSGKDRSAQYDRVLSRLRRELESAEHRSWEYLQEKIEEAVELELTAEEMTRDEMDLLSAYLKKDLKQLGYYAHETGEGVAAWLNFDLNALEQTVAQQLMDLADRTRIGITELEQRLAEGEDYYAAGDTALAGTFVCVDCGEQITNTHTAPLSACPKCGSETFTRLSAPWSGEQTE